MNKNSDAEERVMSAAEAEILQTARADGYFIYRPVGSAAARHKALRVGHSATF